MTAAAALLTSVARIRREADAPHHEYPKQAASLHLARPQPKWVKARYRLRLGSRTGSCLSGCAPEELGALEDEAAAVEVVVDSILACRCVMAEICRRFSGAASDAGAVSNPSVASHPGGTVSRGSEAAEADAEVGANAESKSEAKAEAEAEAELMCLKKHDAPDALRCGLPRCGAMAMRGASTDWTGTTMGRLRGSCSLLL